jgi:L-ascorbate metabolism protein UlaG (beta-lactamase superfamily)
MKIKKLGHCCLVIEEVGKRILTDPGSYSTLQNEVKNIDIILITHEHQDHLHVESLKTVLQNNPSAIVVTNKSVGVLLDKEGIKYQILEHGGKETVDDILLEGFGQLHEEIYGTFGRVENTGYFIADKLFYPGDAFTNPNKKIDILALPVAGPWMKIKTAIDYANELKPRVCFPVHDGMIIKDRPGPIYMLPQKFLTENNIEFVPMNEGDEREF